MKTPNERLNLVFRLSQNCWGTVVLRIAVFVVTASVGQAFAYFVKWQRLSHAVVEARLRDRPVSTAIAIESTPQINFPKSLNALGDVDFWVPVSLVVRSDGGVDKVYVDMERAVTAEGLSFLDEVSRTNGTSAAQLTEEVVRVLSDEVRGTRFKPRTFNGQALPTMVFVDSHFRSHGKSCWTVDCDFKTSEGRFWSVLMFSPDRCSELSN